MSVNTDSMIRNILDRVSRIGYVKPEDIPNIDLYMDQVTTFMEAQLAHSKRYEDDKIMPRIICFLLLRRSAIQKNTCWF